MKLKEQEKILLMVSPFLTPLCPPVGISCLKSFLQREGYQVKTVDLQVNIKMREISYQYFDTLKRFIPETKRGHFFNIGLDVMWNHFMAHLKSNDQERLLQTVKILVQKNFLMEISTEQGNQLINLVNYFYQEYKKILLNLYCREKPTILGLSTYKGTLASSLYALKLMKEINSDVVTFMGGPIFSQHLYPDTPNYHRFIKEAVYIDKVFIGEGEQLLLKYLNNELSIGQKVFTLEDIDNHLLNLDTLELPDYTDFNLAEYPMLPAYTSRGCVKKCSFCAETLYWKKYRCKNIEKIVHEFSMLYKKYGRRLFMLTDCLINPIASKLSQGIIDRNLPFYWDVYLRVDERVSNPEYTFLWRRGGFYRGRLGVESGSQKILDLMDKGITIEQIKKSLISLAEAGIKTSTYWVAGHPGETEDDFQKTLDLVEELQDVIYEAECDPFRYYFTGQVSADYWASQFGNQVLYPEEMTDLLLVQTWELKSVPSREIGYERACRFREHCKKLGISNPYTVSEIHEADRRWTKLQKNAVPSILDLNNGNVSLEEKNSIRRQIKAKVLARDDVEFAF